MERVLLWEGCHNVRDLGGLETASGGRTRHAGVVRADNVRRLSPAGWDAALEHGVGRVVDLRFEGETPGEPEAHPGVDVLVLPLRTGPDAAQARAFEERIFSAPDIAPVIAAAYVGMLDELRPRVGAIVGAIADAPADRCVVVHCFAGKDRTGLIAALLLSLVGVSDEVVAEDYRASDSGVERLSAPWFAAAADEDELALRRLICTSPKETMLEVLVWLRENEGGPEAYLASAGVTGRQVAALRARLT